MADELRLSNLDSPARVALTLISSLCFVAFGCGEKSTDSGSGIPEAPGRGALRAALHDEPIDALELAAPIEIEMAGFNRDGAYSTVLRDSDGTRLRAALGAGKASGGPGWALSSVYLLPEPSSWPPSEALDHREPQFKERVRLMLEEQERHKLEEQGPQMRALYGLLIRWCEAHQPKSWKHDMSREQRTNFCAHSFLSLMDWHFTQSTLPQD